MKITGAVLEVSGAEPPFARTRPFTVGELELDPPQAGELLVRIEAAGVCHSDLSVVDGNRVRPMPMLLGHEAAGIVEQVGEGVDDLAPGDRVVMTFLPAAASATDAAPTGGCRVNGGLRPTTRERCWVAASVSTVPRRGSRRCTTTSASRRSRRTPS